MTDASTLFALSVSILFAWLYVSWCRALRRDIYRNQLRTLRDNLFDYMLQNDLDFNRPAYVRARQTLNGMIRLSNSMSIWTLVCIYRSARELDEHGFRDTTTFDDTNSNLKLKINAALTIALEETSSFVLRCTSGRIVFACFTFVSWLRGIAKGVRTTPSHIAEKATQFCLGLWARTRGKAQSKTWPSFFGKEPRQVFINTALKVGRMDGMSLGA